MSGSIVKNAIALNEAAAHNIVFVILSSQAKLTQPFGMPKPALLVISNRLDNSLSHFWPGDCPIIL